MEVFHKFNVLFFHYIFIYISIAFIHPFICFLWMASSFGSMITFMVIMFIVWTEFFSVPNLFIISYHHWLLDDLYSCPHLPQEYHSDVLCSVSATSFSLRFCMCCWVLFFMIFLPNKVHVPAYCDFVSTQRSLVIMSWCGWKLALLDQFFNMW